LRSAHRTPAGTSSPLRRRILAAVLAVGTVGATGGIYVGTAEAAGADAYIQRHVTDDRITESSGLARSRRHDGVLWTHNDSGDGPNLYALDWSGATVATYTLPAVAAVDWEALAPGMDGDVPVLFVGDLGDNGSNRPEVVVHRVAEPAELSGGRLPSTSYRLRYPDGPHDAETLLVDPATQRLYVVTKARGAGAVYAAPGTLDPHAVNTLQRVGSAPPWITDGTFVQDGRVVLRNYTDAWVYDRLGGSARWLPIPVARQGESLAASFSGTGIYLGSEGRDSVIWRVSLP
jgi:hypothetical protein